MIVFFALSLDTDGGKKLVPIGQHFTKLDKFELFNATKDTLWKGKKWCYYTMRLSSATIELS